MNRTYIVTWMGTDNEPGDWMPCFSREDAERTYKAKVEQDCWTVSLCAVLRSTDYFSEPEVKQ